MNSRDALLKCDQEEIQHHHMVIQNPKSKMNLSSPICNLPPEILAIIFSFVKASDPYQYDRDSKTWIREITHICTHWRNVALNALTLWNDPPPAHQTLAVFLERSKSTPLYIEWTDLSLNDGGAQSLEQLLEHTERIRHLRLRSFQFTDEENNMLLRISNRQLGLLEVLDLSSAIVPDALLVETKALRELHLEDCTVNWEPFTRNDLKALTLSNSEAHNPASPTLSKLLGIIGRMASLTSLVLRHAFVAGAEVYWHVHLSNLQFFIVESSLVETIGLLQSTTFSKTASVKIIVELLNHETDNLNILFAAITDARSRAPLEGDAYLTLAYEEHDSHSGPYVRISLFRKAMDIHTPTDKIFDLTEYLAPDFSIALKLQDRDLTSGTNIRRALAAFMDSGCTKMDNVKYVFLESNLADTYSEAASLGSTIGRLSTVSNVMATGGMMKTLSGALRHKLANSDQYSFPNLAVVSLLRRESIEFWRMNEEYDFDAYVLIRSLEQRRRDNIGVPQVGFDKECYRSILINEGDNVDDLFESIDVHIQLIYVKPKWPCND